MDSCAQVSFRLQMSSHLNSQHSALGGLLPQELAVREWEIKNHQQVVLPKDFIWGNVKDTSWL